MRIMLATAVRVPSLIRTGTTAVGSDSVVLRFALVRTVAALRCGDVRVARPPRRPCASRRGQHSRQRRERQGGAIAEISGATKARAHLGGGGRALFGRDDRLGPGLAQGQTRFHPSSKSLGRRQQRIEHRASCDRRPWRAQLGNRGCRGRKRPGRGVEVSSRVRSRLARRGARRRSWNSREAR